MAIYALTANRSIKANLSAAAATVNPDFIATYADTDGASFVENTVDGVFTGNSDVTIVSAPAGSTRRIVRDINIVNRDSAAVTVNLKFDNAGTQRRIRTVTLGVNETWTMDGSYDVYGNLKSGTTAASNLTITTVTGYIFNGIPNSLVINGLAFPNSIVTVRFSFGSTVDISVTPSSITTLTVSVPMSIYNLSSGTSGTITLIDAAGRSSNVFSTMIYAAPTGGTITTPTVNGQLYRVHTFTTSGTYTVTNFTPSTDYLVVAGGGSGGGYYYAGGGGAGGVRTGSFTFSTAAYTVTIGAGGAAQASNTQGNSGNSTVLGPFTSAGGGGGGANGGAGGSGGSGGGGQGSGTGGSGNTPSVSPSQGNAGGTSNPSNAGGSGGGGAGAAGTSSLTSPSRIFGTGGDGIQTSISGSATYYGGGGGGSIDANLPPFQVVNGGLGGGGNSGTWTSGPGANTAPTAGTANTGGGGGGACHVSNSTGTGAAGGSGIVVIRYVWYA